MWNARLFCSGLFVISLAACGGGSGGDDSTGGGGVVPPTNTSPVLDFVGNQQLFEGTSDPISTLSATDADGDALSFSITGSDVAFFEISDELALIPKAPFDFEVPSDDAEDNIYEITITVSDGAETVIVIS